MNRKRANIVRAIVCALLGLFPSIAAAQAAAADQSVRHEIFPNSIPDNYLRYLQSVGKVPLYPWSSRPFSQRELARLLPKDTAAHPWANRFDESPWEIGGVGFGFIQPATSVRINSAFAYGFNDGPIWAGRGLTSALQAGFFAEYGPVTLTVAPMAFRAENSSFDMLPTGRVGNAVFGDPTFAASVDRPQRFGNSAYSQIDPGQTTLRVDLPYIMAGVSTANQEWGPGEELPVILGNNAAGFPHLFVGTSEPIDLFIAKLHTKLMWGELFQSDYSTVTGPDHYVSRTQPGTKRFTTGIVFSIQPRGIEGLEVGGIRFFHSVWPASGLPRSYVTKVFQGILKKDLPNEPPIDSTNAPETQGATDNQLISVFARWVFPRSGFEISAEYGRDDHSYDFRDLQQEIDHSRAYSIGARKVFSTSASSLTAGRLEIMNFQLPQLDRYRGEGEMYVHGLIRQGHTYKGQLLGADVGVGTGAGSVMAVDHFSPKGRWTASWTRIVRQENGDYTAVGIRSPRSIDVSHALGYEATRFFNSFELTYGLALVRDFNRDFKSDVTNVNALLGARYVIY